MIAASPLCFTGFDPWVGYRYLEKAGVHYVEVPALSQAIGAKHGITSFAPEAMDAQDIQILRDRLTSMGLKPLTVTAMCHLNQTRDVEALRRRIDFARDLGCAYIITDSCEDADLERDRSRIIGNLRSLGDYAANCGICIALETHAGPTRNGRIAKRFLEEVAHPNVGYNYDTGNICYYNEGIDPAEDIQEVAEHVVHVHLKDTQGGKEEWKFCGLGEGHVNFAKIIQVLKAAGFDGPYSLEIEGMQDEDLNREENLQRVVRSLEYLKSVGLHE